MQGSLIECWYIFSIKCMDVFLNLLYIVLMKALDVLQYMVLAYVILSWIPIKIWRVREFLSIVLGPIFQFVRKYSPNIGVIDLSAIFVWILIDLAKRILVLVMQSLT